MIVNEMTPQKISPMPPTSPVDKLRRAAAIILFEAGVTDLDKITPEQKKRIAAGLYMIDHGGENPVTCRLPGYGHGFVAEVLEPGKGIDWRQTPDGHAIGAMLGLRQPARPDWIDVGQYVYVSSPNGMRGSNVRINMLTDQFAWIAGTGAVPIGYVIANYKPSSEAPFRIGLPCPTCGDPFDDDMLTAPRTDPCAKCQENQKTAALEALASQLASKANGTVQKTGDLSAARETMASIAEGASGTGCAFASVESIVPQPLPWSEPDADVPKVVSFAGHAFTAKRVSMRSGLGHHVHEYPNGVRTSEDEDDRARRPYEIEVDAAFTPDTAKTLGALIQRFEEATTESLTIAGTDAHPAESIHILRAGAIDWRVVGRSLHVVFREDMTKAKDSPKEGATVGGSLPASICVKLDDAASDPATPDETWTAEDEAHAAHIAYLAAYCDPKARSYILGYYTTWEGGRPREATQHDIDRLDEALRKITDGRLSSAALPDSVRISEDGLPFSGSRAMGIADREHGREPKTFDEFLAARDVMRGPSAASPMDDAKDVGAVVVDTKNLESWLEAVRTSLDALKKVSQMRAEVVAPAAKADHEHRATTTDPPGGAYAPASFGGVTYMARETISSSATWKRDQHNDRMSRAPYVVVHDIAVGDDKEHARSLLALFESGREGDLVLTKLGNLRAHVTACTIAGGVLTMTFQECGSTLQSRLGAKPVDEPRS